MENDYINAFGKISQFQSGQRKSVNNLTNYVSSLNQDSMCVNKKESWMELIKAYLKNETFPEDRLVEKIKMWLSFHYLDYDPLY